MRIDKFREFREYLDDLVGTFAAGCHHDHVGLSLLCNRMLEDGLSAAERTRDEARSAFSNRVEGVDHPDSRLHDLLRPRLFLVGLHCHLYRPSLDHRDVDILSVSSGQDSYRVVDLVRAGGHDGLHGVLSPERERHHDFVREPSFLDLSEPVSGLHLVSDLGQRGEFPVLRVVERIRVLASPEEDGVHCCKIVLESVIDAGKKTGPERNLEHPSFELYGISVLQSACAFEHLDRSLVSGHLDDLREEGSAVQSDVAELILGYRSVNLDGYKVGNDSCYLTCCFHMMSFFNLSVRHIQRP